MGAGDSQPDDPMFLFRKNFRQAVANWRLTNGRTLRDFAAETFPADSDAELRRAYKWVRKLYDQGSAYKPPGTKNHHRLKTIHAALSLDWPVLWQPQQEPEVQAVPEMDWPERFVQLLGKLTAEDAAALVAELDAVVTRWEQRSEKPALPTDNSIRAQLARARARREEQQ